MPIDLRGLRHVAALGRHRNYARAAAELGITQPALTRSIQALERSLGVSLFDRGRAGVEPTQFGQMLLVRGADLLLGSRELAREIQLMRGLELGRITIGVGPYAAEISVGAALGRLVRLHPKLRVRIVEADWRKLPSLVESGEFDLAIGDLSDAVGQPRLITEPVGRHRGLFVCRRGHPILERAHPTMRHIFGYPHAHFRITMAVSARYFEQHGMAGEVDPASGDFVPSLCFDSLRMIRAVVRESDATTWLPYCLLRDELAAGTLVGIPFEEPWMRLNYGFIWKRNRTLSLAAKAFMTAVREVEAEISSGEAPGTLPRSAGVTIGASALPGGDTPAPAARRGRRPTGRPRRGH